MTFTATVNVIDGVIYVATGSEDIYIFRHNGRILSTFEHVDPWGVEEFGMERADAVLAEMGWRRVSEWSGQEFVTCQVQPR